MEAEMSQIMLYLLGAAVIFGIAIHGLLIGRHLLRKLFALNLMASAVFLFLIALGGNIDGVPDPVPQALVLTGIVVTVSVTAFALSLMVRLHRASGSTEVDQPGFDDDSGHRDDDDPARPD